MKRALRLVHKYLSLTMAVLWLLQAITGVLLVFHWELDDWGVSGPRQPLNADKLGASIERWRNTHTDRQVIALYTSGGLSGRFDVVVTNPAGSRDVLRVDGEGTILRERPWNHDYAHIGVFQIATYLHQTLFLHTTGNWIMGVSGLLLLSNLCMGLYQAWPRAGQWLRALSWPMASGNRSAPAKAYQWHRAAGLTIAIPALVLVLAGVVRAFDDPLALADRFEAQRPAPALPVPVVMAAVSAAAPASAADTPAAPGAPPTLATVISTALALYPGATLAAVELPDPESPWFSVRVTQSHDVRRFFGTTALYISNQHGTVLANYDSNLMPPSVRAWDAVYALHTGEIAGAPGRWLVTLVGLGLLTLIGLGLCLYCLRRNRG